MSRARAAIILAAGQGKRMKSDLPKVLQPLAGRPLLAHVVEAARTVGAADIHVVFGHGGERVREALHDDALRWALQSEQQGTGHAVMQAMPDVPDDALVLVLYGDVPLVRPDTLRRLVAEAGERRLALLSVRMKDPTGYGRVIRDANGDFVEIVEQLDATPEQREIREVFPSYYCFRAEDLIFALSKVTNNNKKGEYYLTDTYGILRQAVLAHGKAARDFLRDRVKEDQPLAHRALATGLLFELEQPEQATAFYRAYGEAMQAEHRRGGDDTLSLARSSVWDYAWQSPALQQVPVPVAFSIERAYPIQIEWSRAGHARRFPILRAQGCPINRETVDHGQCPANAA